MTTCDEHRLPFFGNDDQEKWRADRRRYGNLQFFIYQNVSVGVSFWPCVGWLVSGTLQRWELCTSICLPKLFVYILIPRIQAGKKRRLKKVCETRWQKYIDIGINNDANLRDGKTLLRHESDHIEQKTKTGVGWDLWVSLLRCRTLGETCRKMLQSSGIVPAHFNAGAKHTHKQKLTPTNTHSAYTI